MGKEDMLKHQLVILHIPHASRRIPEEVKGQFVLNERALECEVNLLTDHFTDWILAPLGVPIENQIVAPISRLVVDMERFSNDTVERMAEIGMGVIYEKGSQLQAIRRQLQDCEKQSLITQYYDSHHQKLETQTELMLQAHGRALIIDVHSYPEVALPYERDHSQSRPEICIGTCEYHTSKALEKCLVEAFERAGFEVGLNTPFAGTLIPSKYWQKDKRVMGFMIEVRRDVYMDENSVSLSTHSDAARKRICDALNQSLDLFFASKEAYTLTDKALAKIYKKAKYIVFLGDDRCRLRVGFPAPKIDELLDKHKTQFAYFITPENPFSQPVGETENQLREQRFISKLNEKSLEYIEGYGTDEEETWPKEHSYLIFCDDEKAMQSLAANFGQKGMLKLAKEKPVSLFILDDMRYREML